MGGVIVYGPQRSPRNAHLAFMIGIVLALVGLYLFYAMRNIGYLVYLTLPGIGIALYSLRAYVSGRRRTVWVEEAGAIWGYRNALVPSPRLPGAGFIILTVFEVFFFLIAAWALYREPSDWLGILIFIIIILLPYLYFGRRTFRDFMAARAVRSVSIRDVLLYGDRLRIRTGVNEVLDIPLSEVTICIAGLGLHDMYGNALDILKVRYAGTTYTLTVPGGVGQEFINALKSVGIDEVHTCNYLGIK